MSWEKIYACKQVPRGYFSRECIFTVTSALADNTDDR